MEKKVERKENLEVVVSIACNGDEWKKYTKKEFNKAASKVTVKGFRPGHVPADMVKARVNMAQVLNEALFNAVNDGFATTVNEEKLNVYTQPKLEVSKISEEGFEATVTFALAPEVTLGQYKELGIKAKAVRVLEKDVKAYIDNLKAQHAVMQVKDGEAKLGDYVIIDFVGYVDGAPFEGGDAKGYELELGSNSFIPGFEDALVGIKAGEKRSIDLTFPENYVEKLKGKPATFDVTCSDVKEKVTPKLTKEFIEELGLEGVTDEETLKAYCKEQISKRKEQENKNAQLDEIISTAINNATVVVPNAIVEEEANAMLDQMLKQMKENGLTYQDYVSINGGDEKALEEQRKAEALKNIKASLVVNKIMLSEGLGVTQQMLDAQYQSIADQYKMTLEDVKKALEPNKNEFLRQLSNKVFTEFMLAHN
ncbi:MAG: trigger factor [Bacilli bacterium]|nr:trigger factor [Bacilli bacterium]